MIKTKKNKLTKEQLELLFALRLEGHTWNEIAKNFKGMTANALRKAYYRESRKEEGETNAVTGPKILLLDIETAPMLGYVWSLWENNVALNQLHSDWYILSWSAKWLGSPEDQVMYMDQRNEKNIEDDSKILRVIWDLLDEADIVLTQNGIKFDIPKLNARFIQHGFPPPSSFRHIDTARIARARFGFTSNKLEYMTDKLCVKYKKSKHKKFEGFSLWKECMVGNLEAWKEMEEYNKYDVLSLEELYTKLAPWDKTINFNVYNNDFISRCSCGSSEFKEAGFHYTNRAKYKKHVCVICGKEHRDTENLLTKEKRKSMKV
jgi:hypothetical protein